MNIAATRSLLIMIALGSLLCSGCAAFYNPERPISFFLEPRQITPPDSFEEFMTCNHYGCNGGGVSVGLTQKQWQRVAEPFTRGLTDAESERAAIARAIALMEELVGPQNSTFADQACNNFREPVESYQHDCVAETINTTIYLMLLQQTGLLRWHRVAYPAHRAIAGALFQHYSAVIKELHSNDLYVVDSWFYANGEPAVVVPLARWRKNYNPSGCL